MIKLLNKLKVIPTNPGPPNRRKSPGQGMVEFALALPILLLVVYGLLETGRLIFIYASTLNAARQAARYGAASGLSDAGVPYYRDCDGIRNAANRVGWLNTYNDINITYDGGLDTDGDIINIPGINSSPSADTCSTVTDSKLGNGDRIKVQVTTQWSPIIAIVPSWQGFTITSASERTLLMDVALGVDPVGQSWVPGGVLDLTVSGSPATFDEVGDTLSFTYTLKNIGTIDLTNLSVSDNPGVSNCAGLPATLAKGASFTCTVTYTVVQADLDAGNFVNIVSANSTEALSDTKSVTINAIQTPGLTLAKTPSDTVVLSAGTVITYTYKLTNSGNVTLTSPYTVTDDKIDSSAIDCSGAAGSIAPGSFTQCTGAYTLTDADLSNKYVTNTASATATFQSTTVTSNSADATVSTAALGLSITPSVATATTLNQKITYLYTLKNQSTATLNAPYSVSDSLATNISCSSLSSLSPGETTTCTGEYFITQADLDAGTKVINTATAASDGGVVESSPAKASVSISQLPALSLSITPSTNLATTLGASVNYDYVIQNSGNVTLSAPFTVTDLGLPGPLTCTVSSGSLAPLATTTCTLPYSVTQADLDAGSIINLASVATQYNESPVNSSQATATVITYNAPRLTLSISSSPPSYQSSGTPLTISFTLKNTGNVALTSPYTVSANAFLGSVNCASATSPLNVGQSTNCTASYTTTSTDVNNGSVSISATATAMNGAATLTSNTATLTIYSSLQCYVYHRLTSTPAPSITFSGSGAGRKMYMSVINDSATSATISISQLQVRNWNFQSNSQQYISAIFFGGTQIITGNNTQRIDPITYTSFTGGVSLAPGQTKVLMFEFNKNYTETGNEIIKITFAESGCPVLDSSNGTQVK